MKIKTINVFNDRRSVRESGGNPIDSVIGSPDAGYTDQRNEIDPDFAAFCRLNGITIISTDLRDSKLAFFANTKRIGVSAAGMKKPVVYVELEDGSLAGSFKPAAKPTAKNVVTQIIDLCKKGVEAPKRVCACTACNQTGYVFAG